jgi:hypothetical protein
MVDHTLNITDEGIRLTNKTGHFAMLLVIWSAKSLAHSIKNETEEAKKALSEASKLVAGRKIISIYYVPYVLAKAQIELLEIKSGISSHKIDKEKVRTAFGTINNLVRISRKMRSLAVEAYRLKAVIYWMLKKQNKAYKNFTLSIQSGQKYNAVMELSRTYFEVGKCLREPVSKRSSLLGIGGSEYLLKARTLFEEMDLQWDLQAYEEYMES